jgi:PAS domain S-box-containing protein
MSPATAVVFRIAGISLLLLIKNQILFNKKLLSLNTGILSLISTFISLIFILSYLYGNPLLYNQGFTIPMAISTAISFFLLNLSILLTSQPNSFPLKLFVKSNTESLLLITFLPLTLMVLLLGSIILTITENILGINKAFLSALLIVLVSVITGFLIFFVTKKISITLNNTEQARLNILISNLQQGVILFSETSEILFMNELGRKFLIQINSKYGISEHNDKYKNYVLPNLLNKLMKNNSLTEKIIFGGEIRFFEIMSKKIISNRLENNHIVIIRDITEKNKNLIQIDKFSKIVEQASNSIIITNENGIIEFANTRFQELLGIDKKDLIGKNFSSTLVKESNILYNKVLNDVLISKNSWKGEFQHLRIDNTEVWVNSSVVKLIDENGVILNNFIIEDDITPLKELTKKLESNSLALYYEKIKFESILNNIPFGVAVVQENLEILFINNSLSKIVENEFGTTLSIGERITKILYLKIIENALNDVKSGKKNSQILKFESNVHWELTIDLIKNEILKSFFIIIVKDVTELVEFELLQKQFITTVSHELRTPIAAIQLSINNYLNYIEKLNEDQKDNLLAIISQNSLVLKNIVEDLLILSRIDEKSLKFRKNEKIFIKDQIKTIILQISSLINEKNISITLIEHGNPVIHGDSDRYNQIIRIILENAIKYSPKDKKIIISFESDYNGEYSLKKELGVLITIQDFGKGIPLKEQKFIGKRFFRGSNVANIEGTGIGLSILGEILTLFNGNYFFKSVEGEGTTFILFFPFLRDN